MKRQQRGRPPMPSPKGMPAVIRSGRLSLGMTLDELSTYLGVGRSTLADWESGAAKPPLGKLRRIAEAIGVRVEKLIP